MKNRSPTDPLASTLAAFVNRLQPADIPPAIIERASHLLLDAIGCGLAARGEAFATRCVEAIDALARADLPRSADHMDSASHAGGFAGLGGAPVLGFEQRLPLRDAMLANGILCHGLDYDDTHIGGVLHLTVAIAPAVLALAAHRGANGRDALTAYIAGIEAGARIAAVASGGFHAKGFHPTGVVGAFASALACGKLLGLDAEGLLRAQGMALSFASGSLQFLDDGAWTKRFHPGWAAQAGYQAAHFAANGIPAPSAPLAGRFGLYALYLGDDAKPADALLAAVPGLLPDGSVVHWELPNVAIKPFPLCHLMHASADAAIGLREEGLHDEAIRSIERIEVRVPAGTMPVIGTPQAGKRRPQSDYEAKFSVHYAVACGLLRGRVGLRELEAEAFTDPAALALMDRIDCVADPDADYPRYYGGEVRVTLADGSQRVRREAINRGHAERPLSNEAIRRKFDENATLHFTREHADALASATLGLGLAPTDGLSRLDELLSVGPHHDR